MIPLTSYNPILLALLATVFTWLVTALGASLIFFTKNVNRKLLDISLGFAAGVMIAASFWSLLSPAIELSKSMDNLMWFPASFGFLVGAFFLAGVDKIVPHLHMGQLLNESEGPKTTWHKNRLLLLAVTIHNIPEGLAVGIAFGALALNMSMDSLMAAIALALGIGIQNFPEGIAVSFPLRGEGLSKNKSFFYGQLSAIVEPIAGVLGAFLVTMFTPVLPYALSFAAGAMMFVVIEDIIPECQREGNIDSAAVAAILGFIVMMILDVTLG